MDIDGYIDTAHLEVAVTIEGSEVLVDYTGTSPQSTKGSINSSYNSTLASTMYPFKCALAPDVPNNEALFRPIRIRVPEGSILNTRFPSAVKARAKTINNLNQVLFGALWPLFNDQSQASNGGIWPLVLKGDEPGYGRYIIDMLPHGGRGALPAMDGMVPVSYPENSTITPCEVIESQAPVLFREKALRPDTGGPGQYRGGLGQTVAFRHVGETPIIFSLTPDRITTPPHGFGGGKNICVGEVLINNVRTFLFSAIELQPGDTVELHLTGGGGFGQASERNPAQIRHDIAMG
jgi:N-methylhydantoinase B/oxoprolinase/acetone carboxylase alpha subunit